jgi:hypothetical protein
MIGAGSVGYNKCSTTRWKDMIVEMGLGKHGHRHARVEVGRCRGDVVRRGDVVAEGEWGKPYKWR